MQREDLQQSAGMRCDMHTQQARACPVLQPPVEDLRPSAPPVTEGLMSIPYFAGGLEDNNAAGYYFLSSDNAFSQQIAG